MSDSVDLRKEILCIPQETVKAMLIEAIRDRYGIENDIVLALRWVTRGGQDELQVCQDVDQCLLETLEQTKRARQPGETG